VTRCGVQIRRRILAGAAAWRAHDRARLEVVRVLLLTCGGCDAWSGVMARAAAAPTTTYGVTIVCVSVITCRVVVGAESAVRVVGEHGVPRAAAAYCRRRGVRVCAVMHEGRGNGDEYN
jgi:hypothetical protein